MDEVVFSPKPAATSRVGNGRQLKPIVRSMRLSRAATDERRSSVDAVGGVKASEGESESRATRKSDGGGETGGLPDWIDGIEPRSKPWATEPETGRARANHGCIVVDGGGGKCCFILQARAGCCGCRCRRVFSSEVMAPIAYLDGRV